MRSTAAVDVGRNLLFFGTSACREGTSALPYEEAIVALHLECTPAWHWKPRTADTQGLDFGAAPNLFTITVNGETHDVVGEGAKDGNVLRSRPRRCERRHRRALGRQRSLCPALLAHERGAGRQQGGIIATAAVDEAARGVYFGTGPGLDLRNPQRPTVHALDADATGPRGGAALDLRAPRCATHTSSTLVDTWSQ